MRLDGCQEALRDQIEGLSHEMRSSGNLGDPRACVLAVERTAASNLESDMRRWRPVTVHDIFSNIFMPTTVHIPDPLLKSVDRRAKALGISRNRLVVQALEQAVSVRAGWSPEFLQRLRTVDRETSTAVDELLTAVTQARRSKEPRDM
jgi:hypothetical protein